MGIRSPNPQQVPALRCPADFSPSPPFSCDPLQPIQSSCPRDRMPTPPRHPASLTKSRMNYQPNDLSDSDSDCCQSTSVKRKGEYEQLPTCSPNKKHNSRCGRRKSSSGKSDNPYPMSSKGSTSPDCKVGSARRGVSHHQSHSGSRNMSSHTSCQEIIKNNRLQRYRSPRNPSVNSYDEICCRGTTVIHSSGRSCRELPSHRTCCSRGNPHYEVPHKDVEDERDSCRDSVPLASSSRNTSVEYFSSLPLAKRKKSDSHRRVETYSDPQVNCHEQENHRNDQHVSNNSIFF